MSREMALAGGDGPPGRPMSPPNPSRRHGLPETSGGELGPCQGGSGSGSRGGRVGAGAASLQGHSAEGGRRFQS